MSLRGSDCSIRWIGTQVFRVAVVSGARTRISDSKLRCRSSVPLDISLLSQLNTAPDTIRFRRNRWQHAIPGLLLIAVLLTTTTTRDAARRHVTCPASFATTYMLL